MPDEFQIATPLARALVGDGGSVPGDRWPTTSPSDELVRKPTIRAQKEAPRSTAGGGDPDE